MQFYKKVRVQHKPFHIGSNFGEHFTRTSISPIWGYLGAMTFHAYMITRAVFLPNEASDQFKKAYAHVRELKPSHY